MDNARNSYAIVEVITRSASYACVVCQQQLESAPIKLQCGCTIMAHQKCINSKCPSCKKNSMCAGKRDIILAVFALLICCLITVMIVILVLKFGYKVI